MRVEIQQIIGELNETLQQSENDTVKALCVALVMRLEAAIRPQWVPVTERVPNDRRFVFAESDDGVGIYYHSAISGWCFNGSVFYGNVVRWHEIDYPEPPAN